MAFVPAPNIVMCEVLASKDGQRIENRFMVNVFHAPTLADMNLIADNVSAWLGTQYATRLPVDVVVDGIKCTDMSQQNGPFLLRAVNVPGTLALPSMPNEVSYCVSLRSSSAGRSARGRWYWLGLAVANLTTTNRVSATYRTSVVAIITDLIVRLSSVGMAWVIVSYRHNGAPRVGGPVYFVVASATTTDDIVDSQRRRRPGIGS